MIDVPLVNRSDDRDWKKLLKESFLGVPEPDKKNTEKKILERINDLNSKLDVQNESILKLVAIITKMYEDGEINKETFNKLDNFLEDHFKNPDDETPDWYK
jgi:hypothetical protein